MLQERLRRAQTPDRSKCVFFSTARANLNHANTYRKHTFRNFVQDIALHRNRRISPIRRGANTSDLVVSFVVQKKR